MKPTHRLNKETSICGGRAILPEGTEVEVIHMGPLSASVKPSDTVIQIVSVADLDPLEDD